MSLNIKPIICIPVIRGDKEFQFIIPNGVPYSMAYDAAMEVAMSIYAEIEKEVAKQTQILKEMTEQAQAAQ